MNPELLMSIIAIVFTVIGWLVIYFIAKKNSERAEIRGLVSRTIDILVELEKESINIWTSSNDDMSSEDYVLSPITSTYEWFKLYVKILGGYITIEKPLYRNLKKICTENFEDLQNPDKIKIEKRILKIRGTILTIKCRVEEAFIEKYHKKKPKNFID